MAAVLGGLAAAVIWAVGNTFASRAARALGPMLTLAWVMAVGLVLLALVLPWSASPHLTFAASAWLVVGGAGNVVGLLLLYRALRIGQMGVVMPVVSSEGGIAALAAIVAGQAVSLLRGVAMAVTVLGVVMTTIARRPSQAADADAGGAAGVNATGGPHPDQPMDPAIHPPRGHGDRRAAAWAGLAALSLGISLFGTGRAGNLVPAAWAVMPPRVIGVLAITIPLALRRRLRCPPGTAHLVLVAGICEVAGFFAYAAGARHGIAIAAVLATTTGAMGAGFGRLMFGERLRATQLAGVATIFVGVATLSALTA